MQARKKLDMTEVEAEREERNMEVKDMDAKKMMKAKKENIKKKVNVKKKVDAKKLQAKDKVKVPSTHPI